MCQTSVINIILLILFSCGAETIFECVKVSNFTEEGAGCGDAETYPEAPDGSDEDCNDLGCLWSVRDSLRDLNSGERGGLLHGQREEERR